MKRLLTYLTVAIIMLMVPIGVLAEDFYLRSGLNANEGNSWYSWYNNDAAYKFTQNGNEYTYEVDLTGWSGDFTFRVARGKNGTTWSPGSNQTQTITLGTTYTTMSEQTSGGWIIAENTAESKKYLITIGTSSNGEWTWPTSVKVEAASTATFKKGLYIYGEKYDGTSPSYLHYKLQPLNGSTTEYYIDLLADDKTLAGCNRYSTGNDVSDTDANDDTSHATFWADMNNSTFKLAYVATDDSPITTTYGSSAAGSTWKLQPADETPTTEKVFGGDNWEVRNIGGMYRFIVTVDASGVPQSWRYEKYPNQLVIYKLSAASDWTIDGFFYCTRAAGADTSGNYHGYNQKFFGTTNFTQDGEFAFLLGNKWFKRNKTNESNQYTKNTSWDDNGSAQNLKFQHATGTYGAMFDPTQDEYQLVGPSGSTEEPVRIYMIGNAVGTSETSDNFNDWDTSKSTELTYSEEEGCWKGTIDLKKGKYMRFLYNKVKDRNFGEDSYAPTADGTCTNGDTQLNNHVSYNNAAAGGTNINFLKSSGTYTVRFYMDAAEGKDFTSEATYWYTLKLVSAGNDPDATLSPGTDGGNYTVNLESNDGNIELTVTLSGSATRYRYSIGTTPETPSVNWIVISNETNYNRTFGTLSYYRGTISLNNRVVAEDTKTIYITIQGFDQAGNEGEIHTYQYTFNVLPQLNFSPKGGDFINKVKVTITNGTPPFTYKIYDVPTENSDGDYNPGPWDGGPYRTVTLGNDVREFWLSTPGYLKITDANGKEVRSNESIDEDEEYLNDGRFDFTYSTSENYANYYNNGTTSQAVETGGGKDAVSLFVKKQGEGDMYIYAWDYTWDRQIMKYQDKKESELDEETLADIQELSGVTQDGNSDGEASTKQRDPHVKLTKEWPGNFMSEARTMTINGDEYYYLTFSKDKLHKADDEIGLIVNQGSSDNKTADNHFTDNAYIVFSNVNGFTITGDPDSNFALYEFKQTHSEDGYVYFEVPSVDGSNDFWKNGNIYCYAYDGSSNNSWPATNASGNMTLVPGTSNVYYYLVPNGKRGNLIFMSTNDIGNTRTTADQKPGYTYQSHGYYRPNLGENGTAVTTISQMTEESHDALETFYNTEPIIVVETQNYPNGEDYYRMMPCDFTYLLDPTWGGAINPKSTGDEEWSIAHWSGYPAASQSEGGELVTGYRKRITTDVLSQTVYGLDKEKTYTVQALVRAEGENNVNLALSLNGATNGDAYHQMKALHASGAEGSYVNKFGRVEYLTPTDWTNKQEGIGWFKLEASAKPNNAGNLVIAIGRTNGSYFDLADVTLIEEANDADGKNYHTTAKYAAGDFTGQAVDAASDDYTNAWYADYSERLSTANEQKNNAYSFFDRGRNMNAIVFANPYTVIGMNAGSQQAFGLDTSHGHPYNVVSLDENGFCCDVVYLTDYGFSDTLKDFPTSGNNYFMTGYGYGSKYDFAAKKVIFDRNFSTGTTTLCLPFAIAPSTLRTLLNGGNGEGDVMIYTLKAADLSKKTIEYQAVSEDYDIAAFTPLIIKGLTAGEHMKNAALLTKDDYEIQFAPTVKEDDYIPLWSDPWHSTTKDDEENTTADFYGVTTMTGFASSGTTDGKDWMNFLYNAEDDGKFVWAEPWTGHFAGYIKPFRCYMTLWGNAADGNAKEFSVVWNDTPADPIVEEPTEDPVVEPENPGSETTGIATMEQLLKNGNVYTVDGRLVSRNMIAGGLQKGIYMVNGKKFVIK